MKHVSSDVARKTVRSDARLAAQMPAVQDPLTPARHAEVLRLQQAAGNGAVTELLQQRGRPLEPSTRARMESSFGESFADVDIHTGTLGDGAAAEHDARALTVGSTVAFRAGEYAPDTLVGQRLIAHELAHVVQQRRGGDTPSAADLGGSAALEADARSAADAVTVGAHVAVRGASAPRVAANSFEDEIQKQLGLPPKNAPVVVDLTKIKGATDPNATYTPGPSAASSMSTQAPAKKPAYLGPKLAPDQEWAAEALGLEVHPDKPAEAKAKPSAKPAATSKPNTPAKQHVGVDHKADPHAYPGLELAYTADYSVEHVQSRGTYKSTFYWLTPQFRTGTDLVVFYSAYNPELKRIEYIIGPSQIKNFLSKETLFRYNAAAAYPLAGDMPEYKAKSAKVAARAMEGDAAGAWKAWKESWSAAARDPNFWVEATMATAGGALAAEESAAARTARGGAAVDTTAGEAAASRVAGDTPVVRAPVAANDNAIPPTPAKPSAPTTSATDAQGPIRGVIEGEGTSTTGPQGKLRGIEGGKGKTPVPPDAEPAALAATGTDDAVAAAKAPGPSLVEGTGTVESADRTRAMAAGPKKPTAQATPGTTSSTPGTAGGSVPVRKMPPGPKPRGQRMSVKGDEALPEGTQGVSKNPPGAKKQSVGSQVGNWSHTNFEQLDDILRPQAESLTGGKLPAGLRKEVEVPVPELPPGKRPRMDRVNDATAEVIEIKPKSLEQQGLAEAQGYADQMNKYMKRTDGKQWTPRVVTYDYDAVEAFLRKIGYLE